MLFIIVAFAAFLLCIPLTIANIIYFFERNDKFERITDILTIILGSLASLYWFSSLSFPDYQKALVIPGLNPSNGFYRHTYLASEHAPTILLFLFTGIVAYLILRFVTETLPPLFTVFTLSAIYITDVIFIITIIQLSVGLFAGSDWSLSPFSLEVFFSMLFPLNYILCSIRLIRDIIKRQLLFISENQHEYKNPFLRFCNKLLSHSLSWVILPFICALPLLALIILVLILFGQKPDAAIRAFTETSDWALSQKISPPPVAPPPVESELLYGGHYLCTVALKGNQKLVKPTREGIRHGRRIVVNRQLCVANAFEECVAEKSPRFHRFIRGVYDKYGYPLSKHITTPARANIIYLLMKPLEYIFLFFLYTVDGKPENRIAMQYTGR